VTRAALRRVGGIEEQELMSTTTAKQNKTLALEGFDAALQPA
jgi:hypothetical protein